MFEIYFYQSAFSLRFKVSEPYLDTKRACLCVDAVLEKLKGRQLTVTKNWQTFKTEVTEKKDVLIQLEENMVESTRVSLFNLLAYN